MAQRRGKLNALEPQDTDNAPPTLSLVADILLTPVRAATSPTALRTYARTALLLVTATLLYLLAIVAYITFYNAYVPDANFFVPIHLQFDHLVHGAALDPVVYHPYAVADIATSSLRRRRSGRWIPALGPEPIGAAAKDGPAPKPGRMISGLEYDIDVVMTMPRAPLNLAAGNFMLELSILGPLSDAASTATSSSQLTGSGSGSGSASAPPGTDTQTAVLAYSSRPATLTYTSPLLAHAAQFLTMPLYLLNLRSESETLRIPMLERVAFPRSSAASSAVPDRLRLQVNSRERLQVYTVAVEVRARFAGVRWLMSRHRILSFLLFTALFWAGEMGFALLVWGAASLALAFSAPLSSSSWHLGGGGGGGGLSSSDEEDRRRGRADVRVKTEDPDEPLELSDTERSFPTYARQPPLRYSSPRVKDEEEEEEGEDGEDASGAGMDPRAAMMTGAEAADDEDEDADFLVAEEGMRMGEFHDSGLGTGMESSAGGAAAAAARRRKGNK